MTRLAEEMDRAAKQRAADMEEVQREAGLLPDAGGDDSTPFGIYTWDTVNGAIVCHLYFASDKDIANALGYRLKRATPTLNYMVLPVEHLPEELLS